MAQFHDLTVGRITASSRADARTVFGQVMGLVAITCLFCALGAYIGRDVNVARGGGFIAFIVAFDCLMGLRAAQARSPQLAMGLLFAVGLLFGIGLGPVLNSYASTDPSMVNQSAGATAGFIGIVGSYGYATPAAGRADCSSRCSRSSPSGSSRCSCRFRART